MRRVGIVVVLLMFSGKLVAQKPDEGIARVRAMWVADFKAKDADKLASLYGDDATLVPESGERIVGREDIRRYFRELFGSISSADVSADSKGTDTSGDFGYDSGLYHEVIVRGGGVVVSGNVTISGGVQIGGGSSRTESQGNYLVVLRRRAGTWLIVQQASVGAPPATK